jgi:hypothetical protein
VGPGAAARNHPRRDDANALRAIPEWMNRVYGRPTERIAQVDVNAEPERVKQLRQMSREERIAYLRKLEASGQLQVVDDEVT